MYRNACLIALLLCVIPAAAAEDWPMFRHDRELTATTKEKLDLPLDSIWVYRLRQWKHPEWLRGSQKFEHSVERARYEVSISSGGDAVFVTSKADGRILCLAAESGALRWERVTGGGVNRPPTYFDGKVYAGSDDGHVYCIDAKTGKDVWVHKAAPANRWLFSYNQMMSVWTVRTNVLIDKGVAYFGCGVLPHDGTFITALDPRTGKLIWKNDTHSETRFRWAVSPHGNIYATETNLYIPNDAKPFRWIEHNAFRRSDGRHVDWGGGDPRNPGQHGGKDFEPLKANGVPETPGYGLDAGSIQGTPRMRYAPLIYNPDLCSVITTDGALFSVRHGGGAKGGVAGAVFAHVGEKNVWSSKIDEWPNQVIAANGRLFVSTRDGTVYGYAPKGAKTYGVIDEPVKKGPFVKGPSLAKAAEEIVKRSGVVDGYALVLDCTTGELARELAARTKLHISAVFDDEAQAVAARKAVSDANLHVSRIIVWTRKPGEPLPFPPRFADLVTSEAAAYGKALPKTRDGLDRLLKPVRGRAVIGGQQQEAALKDWIKWTRQDDWTIAGSDGSRWALRTGPRLEGAGAWSTNAGDAGHTMCSNDEVLKPPLGCVWIGRPFIAKGWLGSTPAIMADGVFVHQFRSAHDPQGYIEGYDQYTGRRLWHNKGGITDTVGANGAVILRYQKFLIQLDPWTGQIAKKITPLYPNGDWTKMAMDRNGTTLYLASTGVADGRRWSCVLAYDVPSGNVLWKVGGPGAERRWGNWNCISDGRIYGVGGKPNAEELAECKADMLTALKKMPGAEYRVLEKNIDTSHSFTMLTAHDAKTGKFLYRKPVDTTNAGGNWTRHVTNYTGRRDRGYHPHIRPAVLANGGVVIFCTEGAADKCWRVWPGGGYAGRALSVYDGATGKLLWYRYGNYRARPVVTNEFIYAEPWGFNIRTGEPRSRIHPVSGKKGAKFVYYRWDKQCGTIAGSKYFLFGRASGVAYQDLYSDQGLYTIFHSRSSCWIDTSSSGGTMIKPPHSISCQCEVSMPFTFAMGTVPTPVALSQYFCQPGPALPVKHLRLDFGCTGDRRDKKGRLWVLPRAKSPMALDLQYNVGIEGGEAVRRSAVYTPIENTDAPFVFATCLVGMERCTFPISEDPKGEKYKVRLGFSALPGDKKAERVFDVKLNGKVVLKDFDIIKETGKADRAVWKDADVTLGHELTLELEGKPGSKRAPLINAIQVLRQ